MSPPTHLYQPYKDRYLDPQGPGDSRPTALEVVKDENAIGAHADKVFLITGCTAGVGIDTARALYATGARIFMTVRDVTKGAAVKRDIETSSTFPNTHPIELVTLSLDSLASVRAAAAAVLSRTDKLNVLILNAGIMAVPFGRTADGFENHIGTNHFGHFLFFHLLRPLLLSSATPSFHSRVVVVSSAGHRFGPPNLDDINYETPEAQESYVKFAAYGRSKCANVYMANSIERHYSSRGLHALSVHPGIVATELGRHLAPEDWEFLTKHNPDFEKQMRAPSQGASTQVWCAVGKWLEGKGGWYCSDTGVAGPAVDQAPGAPGYATHAYDEEVEERLWELSLAVVGVEEA